jgi:hypothetical protein
MDAALSDLATGFDTARFDCLCRRRSLIVNCCGAPGEQTCGARAASRTRFVWRALAATEMDDAGRRGETHGTALRPSSTPPLRRMSARQFSVGRAAGASPTSSATFGNGRSTTGTRLLRHQIRASTLPTSARPQEIERRWEEATRTWGRSPRTLLCRGCLLCQIFEKLGSARVALGSHSLARIGRCARGLRHPRPGGLKRLTAA